jgi:hypothetical protein
MKFRHQRPVLVYTFFLVHQMAIIKCSQPRNCLVTVHVSFRFMFNLSAVNWKV